VVGTDDLEPAMPVKPQIEPVVCVRQGALHMQGPECSRTHAKADLSTFGYDVLTAACRRTSCPLGLIEKVRELRPRPFESGRIDVGDVIGDDFDIELLGTHAGRSDRESSHKYESSNGHS